MGYREDVKDLDRFMRSKEGKETIKELRTQLAGKRIQSIQFTNEGDYVAANLKLEDKSVVQLLPPFLEIETIRFMHPQVFERKYNKEEAKEKLHRMYGD